MTQHPTGLYFDLPEDEYHADAALGSTDLRRLLTSAPDYWWHSQFNPDRPEDSDTPSLIFGRALHCRVLEGQQMYEARFVRRPDDLVRLDAKARGLLAPNGEIVLPGEDYDRIVLAADNIRRNPELATAFEGGMPEVSAFWGEDVLGKEVRMKARFDYLKVRGIGDLKSIRNTLSLPFPDACGRAIASYRYNVQALHYLIGRQHLPELVAHDLVFGDHDRTWLRRVASEPEYGFQFVFFQAEDAPITWSCSLCFSNPALDYFAARDREQALKNYRFYLDKFGTDEPWTLTEPVRELNIDQMPRWGAFQ